MTAVRIDQLAQADKGRRRVVPRASDGAQDFEIGRITKSRGKFFRLALSQHRGTNYLDLRHWFVDIDGTEKPTREGVTIGIDKVADFAQLMDNAISEARGRGWPLD
ncbi:MAG: hypothetical protein HOP13_05725 [Alphaproteobacteria bacterium]|nr:hypothetical protein [Alphaproteobacteria bacterium]